VRGWRGCSVQELCLVGQRCLSLAVGSIVECIVAILAGRFGFLHILCSGCTTHTLHITGDTCRLPAMQSVAMLTLLLCCPCACRYGVWADWAAPYITLQPEYEAAQLRVFGKMFLNGHIYRWVGGG
jgi:hypothetical protein